MSILLSETTCKWWQRLAFKVVETGVISGNQISRSTTNEIPDETTTTIGSMRFQTMGTDRVGHRQAGTEVVCVGKDRGEFGNSVVESGDGREDGKEV
jgi:hypothetical protein